MKHQYVGEGKDSTHFAVSRNDNQKVLVQVSDASGNQVRIELTPVEAEYMAEALMSHARQINT